MRLFHAIVLTLCMTATAAVAAEKPKYVWATAYHILPQTHSDESGYFSLNEGLDGRIYVGTTKYNQNAYLVEFDPRTGRQRIAIDVNKLCGLKASGYASQAKIHTRNFVGASGKIYVGSKQGYRKGGDKSTYPGGYLMTYDPRTGEGSNLGIPLAGYGIIDVTADEKRGLVYVVTCENQHWMLYDVKKRKYRRIGPVLSHYAVTLIDAAGRASVLTKDFQLAQYDPATGKVTVRPILVRDVGGGRGKTFARTGAGDIPTWVLSADRRKAYLILMDDPSLIEIDLVGRGKTARATNHGKMLEGDKPDSRSALSLGPDGRLYAVVRINNTTGFGSGFLHHLVRYSPSGKSAKGGKKMEDLGVLAVKNPDFFNFAGKGGKAGKKPPWSHGYHKLPDGTLTPKYHHMAMIVAADGTVYVTIIYPFTLLKIDAFKLPIPPPTPAAAYLDKAIEYCDKVQKRIPEFTKIAEIVADRHIAGGLIGFPWNHQTLQQELMGRSGNMIHTGFKRPFRTPRTDAEKAKDVAIIGWDRPPGGGDLTALKALRKRGAYVIGFGSKRMPELAKLIPLCDAFFDTGLGADDRVVKLPGGGRAGRANHLVNAVNGWVFTAELIAAFTRRGKMPTMWKAWAFADGREWGEKYFLKKQFHDEYKVPPIPPGRLAGQFLERIRYLLQRFRRHQLPAVRAAADAIAAEKRKGKKTIVASTGHMASFFIAKQEDAAWAKNIETHHNVQYQLDNFTKGAPPGSLVLRLGYTGLHRKVAAIFKKGNHRVLHISAENPRPEFKTPTGFPVNIDMGYAFGDACVKIDGYPLLLFPPSGIMQVVAYESINVEVLSRLVGAAKANK